jgi:hypothetical protein
MNRLYDVAQTMRTDDVGTKPLGFYLAYDRFFAWRDFAPKAIVEIGVHLGESTKIIATAYPDAKIVALDLNLKEIDFTAFPKITYLQADQGIRSRLDEIAREHFPDGIDLVIDDASHIGFLSWASFRALFPHVRSGGIYVIEDWGTGYWDDYEDGGRYQEYPLSYHTGQFPRRIPSHDFGMVGFVKSLVDLVGMGDIRLRQADRPRHEPQLRSLEFRPGLCFAEKA